MDPCPPTFLQPELAQPGSPQRGAVALLTRPVVVKIREEDLRHPDPELIRPATGKRRESRAPGAALLGQSLRVSPVTICVSPGGWD